MKEEHLAAVLAAVIVVAVLGYFWYWMRKPFPVAKEEINAGGESVMRKVINRLNPVFKLDPVKRCEVYKQEGCAHVDGPLCDVETCTMVVENEHKKVIPIKQVSNG